MLATIREAAPLRITGSSGPAAGSARGVAAAAVAVGGCGSTTGAAATVLWGAGTGAAR